MTEPDATRIIRLEERQTVIVQDLQDIKTDIKEIKNMLSTSLVSQSDFSEYKKRIRQDMDDMQFTVDSRFREYQKSQFWQKMMTFLGGVGLSIITAVLLYEVSKILK